MNDAARKISIDVVSDVVCPWCYVGKRKLEGALRQLTDVDVELRWRPFQLDPTIPQGGISRHDYLTKKFGPDRAGTMHHRIEAIGKEAGIDFAFDRIARSPNTLDAHRLIRWAFGTGKQEAVVERLFQLYFIEGRDIGDRDLLADVAAEFGMDRILTRARLDTDMDAADVQAEIASAVRLGVNGVPFFIIDGKYGLSGAQPSDMIADAVRKAVETSVSASAQT